ncbi:MAG: PAS domain S-box protein [Betaproteobacteria bacterium]
MELKFSGSIEDLPASDRLGLLVDSVTDYAIYLLDRDGVIRTWNTGAERIKGYRAADAIGQHFSLFFTPEDKAADVPAQILARAGCAGRAEQEGWRVRKDGGRFWAASVVQPVRDARGRAIGFAKITRDMTERREAQQALYDSERRFRLLVQAVKDFAIYMLDPSGIIMNWNSGAERLKGYSAAEIVGQHFSKFYTRDDRMAGLPARVLEKAARDGHYEVEGWRVRKDGGRFWAAVEVDAIRDERNELIGFTKITRDITERQVAQQTLRETARQFQTLIGGVTDYALFMLDPNGLVVNWNAGAERIKGYSADEIVGQHFSRFYTDRDRAAGLPARALHIATQEGRYEAEGWRVRRDGSLFWANAIIDRITDKKGAVIGFAKITRDITERRNAQLALQEAQAQRAQAQKMEALGQLTGGVAHDFNNLLMIVAGHLQSLKKLVADDEKGRRAAEAIELATKRGAALTRQLLTFSRRQTFHPSLTNLSERIDAFRTMLATSLGASAQLVTDIPPETWPVQIDASEFELALVNVALNARDAMPAQGGVITVSAENVELTPQQTPARLQGEFVVLSIADNGSGIAPDILPLVFDPFFTTKGPSKGSGLGLSQVYGFAHQSGGTVTITSELGRGACVTLYLPRGNAPPMSAQNEGNAALKKVESGAALLVEDNPEVAKVAEQMIEQLGYHVQRAGGAKEALELAEGASFDLVISDIVMAGSMDGVGLARALRQRQPDLPVVLVTGFASSVTELEFAVLRKPFEVSDLSQVIAKAIADAQPVNADNVIRLRDRRGAAERQLSSEARDRPERNGPGRGDDGPGNIPA